MIISVADSKTAKYWKNIEMSWEEFLQKAKITRRTTETVEEYKKLPKPQQDALKNVGGFVAGKLKDGKRKTGFVEFRSMLTLDMDYATSDVWEQITLFYDFTCCIYSTHKHIPEKPRLRLIIPLSRVVTADEYVAIARKVAYDLNIEQFDDTTYEPSRLMYWASTSSDGEFVFESQEGVLLDPDKILSGYKDWKDTSSWPVSSRQDAIVKKAITKQSDPLEKPGLIGAFCRAYSIQDAIEQFIPEVYRQSLLQDRYDYIPADSTAGVLIYDDKFAFSHHATDPACGKLCNAFDLVRLHKFGELDAKVEEDTIPSKLPSFQAMIEFAETDEKVSQTIDEERTDVMLKDFSGEETNPRKMFFKNKRFITMYLANWFLMQHEAMVLQDELYIYENGRYVNAERVFREKATHVLKSEFQTNRLNEALNYMRNTVAEVTPDEATDTRGYLNVKNGLLDLSTFEFSEHTHTLQTIMQIPVEYNPNAKCSAIDKYLNIVVKDSIPIIEEMLGYCLIASMKYEKSFLLYGDGGNGKGTMIALIQALFGRENVSNVALQGLSENRFLSAELFGKMVNLHADIPNRVIEDTSIFKELTSGDRIQAEKKHLAPFSFCNRAKMIFSANEMSSSKDNSYGYHRKWIFVPFENKFDDRELREKLFNQDELTGLLTKAVKGLKRLLKQDGFSNVESVKKQGEEYRVKSDNVYQFLKECCVEDPESKVGKQELYDTYRRKCGDWGNFPVNQGNFNNKIKGLVSGLKEDRNQKIRMWKGIKPLIEDFL